MTETEMFSILKDRLPAFLVALSEFRLYAPIMKENILLFEEITDPKKFSFDLALSENSAKPPKELLFPQTETLYRFKVARNAKISLEKDDENEKIIFGIRPCDARSLLILDQVFWRDPADPYYMEKRKRTITLGVACNTPGINCFCKSVGSEPASKENLDVLFTDIGDKYVAEAATAKGKAVLGKAKNSNPDLIATCSPADAEKAKELHKKAEEKMLRSIDLGDVSKKLDRLFDNSFWNDISSKCLGCGICTYLCPTCYCFDIQDEAAPSNLASYELSGKRVRVWDSCMTSEYTVQASGYNPRPLRMNRIKNRVYHKYNWHPRNFKYFACVGCGRCITSCPVNMDIIEILSKVKGIRD